jgi:hypothetical protein
MSSLDEQDIFGSGPHSFRACSWERCVERRSFAGVDGELVLDMGMRSRLILQQGRLQGANAAAVQSPISQIEAFIDGGLHTLVDNHGQSYPNVLVERFEPTTPVLRGREFWCDYTITYRQLP